MAFLRKHADTIGSGLLALLFVAMALFGWGLTP